MTSEYPPNTSTNIRKLGNVYLTMKFLILMLRHNVFDQKQTRYFKQTFLQIYFSIYVSFKKIRQYPTTKMGINKATFSDNEMVITMKKNNLYLQKHFLTKDIQKVLPLHPFRHLKFSLRNMINFFLKSFHLPLTHPSYPLSH